MTEYDVSDDVAAIVEDSGLPQRLRNEVYSTLESRDVTVEQADEIVRATVAQYEESRVDPLDPVGTVSAQSIGEPGTQMSIPADERILTTRGGTTQTTEIGPLVDDIVETRESRTLDGHEVARAPTDLRVLSLRADERVEWKPVEEVSRHRAPDELLRFELESGRTVRATESHSFVTRDDNEVVPVAGDELSEGDWLPVVASFDGGQTESVDLRNHLPAGEHQGGSTLTDGGTVSQQTGADGRQTPESGDSDDRTVHSRGGTASLPERFPLDEGTGFLVGGFLAAGSLTGRSVSVSNVDEQCRQRIRAVAERFDLTVDEDGTQSGCGIRVDGQILADFLRETCYEQNEKTVPEFAFGASEAFVVGLLSGYFSGAGSVTEGAVRSSSVSERLTEDIALLLGRAGIHATRGERDGSHTLCVAGKHAVRFDERVGLVGERGERLTETAADDPEGPDTTDQIPNFGAALRSAADDADIPPGQVDTAHDRQRIGRDRLAQFVERCEARTDDPSDAVETLSRAVSGDVVWDRIDSIERVRPDHEFVYDVSVAGLETFTTAEGVVTHNTMNTFHYAGVAEIDVTQGLPRLIELVDARKEPDTPMMTVHLEDEYAEDRERAHEVVWNIEATKILQLGDISTNVADMLVQIALNEETLRERWPTADDPVAVAEEIADTIESKLGVETTQRELVIEFGPDEPSYRDLLQLVEELREIVFKGIEDISRVVIRKEETDQGEEFVLYTEGSDFGAALEIEGVDASRTTCNNIHEIYRNLGVEAARESIIEETMNTLEEQGLDDVNIRHLMLVADIMTNEGEIESIGRHGISGAKDSVLARAAFEVTVSHLLDAAIHGEIDELDGVTENVIVGKPIKLGTGDVNLRMSSKQAD